MTTIIRTSAPKMSSGFSPVAAALRMVRSITVRWGNYLEKRRTLQHLKELDARLLDDVGLSAFDLQHSAQLPPRLLSEWR